MLIKKLSTLKKLDSIKSSLSEELLNVLSVGLDSLLAGVRVEPRDILTIDVLMAVNRPRLEPKY
ncbi:MAG: hypothetical protein AUK08_01300 [Candidatus Pacebacteria bacterium CG2_30_36_39]|nr:MAG: hypothetical protein AUK08_01300 [Candidatus Pacebacteria bacterium CG2_30_36_39]